MSVRCCTLVIFATAYLSTADALADRKIQRAALRGLRTYEVVVDVADQTTQAGHVSESDLRTMAEVALRRAGITVVEPSAALVPYVYINLTALRDQSALVAYTVSLEVKAPARLVHNRLQQLVSIWYDRNGVAMVGANGYSTGVRNDLSLLLDRLVNDHLAANAAGQRR